jgi:putative ABC transport system ATP-binding protein
MDLRLADPSAPEHQEVVSRAAGRDDLAVRVEGLCHWYGSGGARNQVLFDVNIEIPPGQLVILTGPSGAGKTTLLTLLGALRSVQHGKVEVLGGDLSALDRSGLVAVRRNIGFIFPMHNLFDALSAYENVKMAAQLRGDRRRETRRRVHAILERLGLGKRIKHRPRSLSTGECQRVAIARALVNRPRLVLADEPTAALDRVSTGHVIALFKEMAENGSTILMVTHDQRISERADRVVQMEDGRIVGDEIPRQVGRIRDFLRTVEPFRSLSPGDLGDVAARMAERHYRRGETVIRQGDPADALYLISSGAAEVVRGRTGPTRLGPGDLFGEGALMRGGRRNTTVVAADELDTLVLEKRDFETTISCSKPLREQLARLVSRRR